MLRTAELQDRSLSLRQLREYMCTPAHPQPLERVELTPTLSYFIWVSNLVVKLYAGYDHGI